MHFLFYQSMSTGQTETLILFTQGTLIVLHPLRLTSMTVSHGVLKQMFLRAGCSSCHLTNSIKAVMTFLRSSMHFCMCVSFQENFCFVSNSVPNHLYTLQCLLVLLMFVFVIILKIYKSLNIVLKMRLIHPVILSI